jgi:hypothetical protein
MKLQQLWHRCDANLVEAFNESLTKFLQKTRHAARQLRTIGCQQLCSRVFERAGIGTNKDDITGFFLCKEDADKLWRKPRCRKESVKIETTHELCRDLKEGVTRQQAADDRKELLCKAGMMGPDGEEQPQQQQQQQQQ